MNQFILTENHLKLLRAMYWEWDGSMYNGVPAVDCKRPYGNSYIYPDIMEICDIKMDVDEDEGFTDEQQQYLLDLHRGTGYALEILLCTGKMEPGTYEIVSDRYSRREWKKIAE